MTVHVWINGRPWTKESNFGISPFDRGLLFGDQFFETFLFSHDRLLCFEKHYTRLSHTSQVLDISLPLSKESLKEELEQCARSVMEPKVAIRLVISRGEGMGLGIPKDSQPSRVVYGFKPLPPPLEWFSRGISLMRVPSYQIPSKEGKHHKLGFYLPSILALEEAKKVEYDDILWENALGHVTESSIANIFFYHGNSSLSTPSLDSGLLPGISRQVMIEMLESKGFKVEEIKISDIKTHKEAFLTSTVRGLIPIGRIDNSLFTTCEKDSLFWKIKDWFDVYRFAQSE